MPLHNLESFANGIDEGWEVPAGSSGSTFGPSWAVLLGILSEPVGESPKGRKILFFTLLLEVFFSSSSSSTDASNLIEKQNRENCWYYENGNSKYIPVLNLDLKPTRQIGSPQWVDGWRYGLG